MKPLKQPLKKGSKVKSLRCYACLNSDRKLFALNKSTAYSNIWRKIVQRSTSGVSLCWECLALLRNVKKFQKKVKNSQTMLKQAGDDQNCLLKNQSTLSTSPTIIIDSNYGLVIGNNADIPDDDSESASEIIDSELDLEDIESFDSKDDELDLDNTKSLNKSIKPTEIRDEEPDLNNIESLFKDVNPNTEAIHEELDSDQTECLDEDIKSDNKTMNEIVEDKLKSLDDEINLDTEIINEELDLDNIESLVEDVNLETEIIDKELDSSKTKCFDGDINTENKIINETLEADKIESLEEDINLDTEIINEALNLDNIESLVEDVNLETEIIDKELDSSKTKCFDGDINTENKIINETLEADKIESLEEDINLDTEIINEALNLDNIESLVEDIIMDLETEIIDKELDSDRTGCFDEDLNTENKIVDETFEADRIGNLEGDTNLESEIIDKELDLDEIENLNKSIKALTEVRHEEPDLDNFESLVEDINSETEIIDVELDSDKTECFDENIRSENKMIDEILDKNDKTSHVFNIHDYLFEESHDYLPDIDSEEDLENNEEVPSTGVQTAEVLTDEVPAEVFINVNKEPLQENKKQKRNLTIVSLERQKRKMKKNYKLEYVKVDNCYTTVPIRPHEVGSWLDKEKNCIFFKSSSSRNKCVLCVMRISRRQLTSHKKALHSNKNKYICDLCKCTFALKSNLVTHMNAHNYIRSCKMCEFTCAHADHMFAHLKMEHSRIVTCLECDMSFKCKWDFNMHYDQMHGVTIELFICDYCKKQFKRKRVLEKHIIRLRQHRNFKHKIKNRSEVTYCLQCDKQFDNTTKFRNHCTFSTVHAHAREKRPYKRDNVACPVCGNIFAKETYMKNHYDKFHAAVPRCQCADCGKTFWNYYKLKYHQMYVHQGVQRKKDKICSFCGRGFADSAYLKKHIRTHTGERPFKCPHCGSSFAQRTPLVRHIKTKHKKMSK